MNKIRIGLICLSLLLLVSSSSLYASEHEHHAAHVHGEAKLLIAVEDNRLEIEFISPAMNIVGFEHLPVDEAQQRAVQSALETLKRPELLFSLEVAADCIPVSVEVASPLAGHHMHADEEEGHSDFTGHYQFQCAAASRLERIDVELFKRFPGTEVIEVQSVSKRGQLKIDLTPEEHRLAL